MNKADNQLTQLKIFKQLTDRSLQGLVNESYQILGNPIILYNLDLEILAYAENVITDDPIWNHHIHNGTITDEMKDFSIKEGLTEAVANANKVELFHSEKLKYDRIVLKLQGSDGIVMAFAIIIAANRSFTEEDLVLAREICKKISSEMNKLDRYKQYGQQKLEFYINQLIDTDVRKDRYAINYIELIYDGLQNYLYIAVADIGQCDPAYTKLNDYKNLFKSIRADFKYATYAQYIIIIMSASECNLHPKKCLHRLNHIFQQDHIKVGISARFENLFELSRYYNQAVQALKEGIASDHIQHIFAYKDASSR